VNSAKILDVKECSKGYVLKDMSGGNNSIDVSKKDNGKINYSLNKVDPDGKEPVLNLPYGAKIKLDEQGNPHLYVKKEKDFEKLKKEMGDKVLINGKNFSDVPHSLIVEQESLIKPSLESNVENKNDAIDKTIPSNVLNELKSVANNLSDIKLNNDNTQGPVNTPVGNISKKLDKHTHAF
jgi:hypothetical protein